MDAGGAMSPVSVYEHAPVITGHFPGKIKL